MFTEYLNLSDRPSEWKREVSAIIRDAICIHWQRWVLLPSLSFVPWSLVSSLGACCSAGLVFPALIPSQYLKYPYTAHILPWQDCSNCISAACYYFSISLPNSIWFIYEMQGLLNIVTLLCNYTETSPPNLGYANLVYHQNYLNSFENI